MPISAIVALPVHLPPRLLDLSIFSFFSETISDIDVGHARHIQRHDQREAAFFTGCSTRARRLDRCSVFFVSPQEGVRLSLFFCLRAPRDHPFPPWSSSSPSGGCLPSSSDGGSTPFPGPGHVLFPQIPNVLSLLGHLGKQSPLSLRPVVERRQPPPLFALVHFAGSWYPPIYSLSPR